MGILQQVFPPVQSGQRMRAAPPQNYSEVQVQPEDGRFQVVFSSQSVFWLFGLRYKARKTYCSVTLEGIPMFRAAAVVLLLLWVLGLATGRTLGGFVHVLLVLALVMGLISLVRGNHN